MHNLYFILFYIYFSKIYWKGRRIIIFYNLISIISINSIFEITICTNDHTMYTKIIETLMIKKNTFIKIHILIFYTIVEKNLRAI